MYKKLMLFICNIQKIKSQATQNTYNELIKKILLKTTEIFLKKYLFIPDHPSNKVCI